MSSSVAPLLSMLSCPLVDRALWMLSGEVCLEDKGQAAVIVIVQEHCVVVRPASHSEVTGAWQAWELHAFLGVCNWHGAVAADLEQGLPLAENLNPCITRQPRMLPPSSGISQPKAPYCHSAARWLFIHFFKTGREHCIGSHVSLRGIVGMTAQAEDCGPTHCFQTRSISRHKLSSTADCALYRGLRHRVAALIKSRDHPALRSAQQRTGLVLRTPGFTVLCLLCFLHQPFSHSFLSL